MDLRFNIKLVEKYHNLSQTARVLTENWFISNMFCPRCGNLKLNRFENNRPVADFYCSICNSEYELKSKQGLLNKKISDGSYNTMIQRITENNNPDLFCMRYSKTTSSVIDLIFIPKYFFTPRIIEKRNPLKSTARRAGWVGCNILIDKIPEQAKIGIISNGNINCKERVINEVKRCELIATKDISMRVWLIDILNCVNAIGTDEFSLKDVYSFENKLSVKHPENNNIQAKIRQQLQLLRDKGFVKFLGNGNYRKV